MLASRPPEEVSYNISGTEPSKRAPKRYAALGWAITCMENASRRGPSRVCRLLRYVPASGPTPRALLQRLKAKPPAATQTTSGKTQSRCTHSRQQCTKYTPPHPATCSIRGSPLLQKSMSRAPSPTTEARAPLGQARPAPSTCPTVADTDQQPRCSGTPSHARRGGRAPQRMPSPPGTPYRGAAGRGRQRRPRRRRPSRPRRAAGAGGAAPLPWRAVTAADWTLSFATKRHLQGRGRR